MIRLNAGLLGSATFALLYGPMSTCCQCWPTLPQPTGQNPTHRPTPLTHFPQNRDSDVPTFYSLTPARSDPDQLRANTTPLILTIHGPDYLRQNTSFNLSPTTDLRTVLPRLSVCLLTYATNPTTPAISDPIDGPTVGNTLPPATPAPSTTLKVRPERHLRATEQKQ